MLMSNGSALAACVLHWTSHGTRGKGVELMAVYKRKYDSGTVLWYFKFQPPGAAREFASDQAVWIRH